MKILVFNYEYPPIGGGGGVVNALIAEELARSHRVAVITSAFGDLPRREVRNGVEIRRVYVPGRNRRQVASLRSLLGYPAAAFLAGMRLTAREPFDVINGHFAVPTGPGSVAVAHRRGLPHALSLHGGDLYDPSKSLSPHRIPPLRFAVGRVLRASDAVVAQSTNTRENVYRYFDYDGPVEVIPLGIRPPEAGPPADRESIGLPEDAFVAATVGRLVARKGLDRLLHVLARPKCAGIHLVVMGAGPELEPLRALAGSLGIAERVHFTGYVEEDRKWAILRCSDVYASTTLHEGFGLVYVEAMMAGLPVLTYDHGGQTDFLRDGTNGALVPAGDEEAFAAALAGLARNPRRAAEIGERNRVESRDYTIARCAGAYEALFERLIATHGEGEEAA